MIIQLHEKYRSHDSFKMERIMVRSGKEHLIILYPQQEWSMWNQSIIDNLWWIFSRYDKKNSHRVKICKWGFSFGHLNCSYPQRPYICLHQAKGASVTMFKASTMLAWREIGVKKERGQSRGGGARASRQVKIPNIKDLKYCCKRYLLIVTFGILNNFWCHPEWCSHKCLSLLIK